MNEKGFSLVELIIVIAIVGVLAAVTVVAFKPQELFSNGRNSRRIEEVNAINTALGQWLTREGVTDQDPYGTLGLLDFGVTPITLTDGTIAGEGVGATTVTQLSIPAYLQRIPIDPNGATEYRIGVNDAINPTFVLVCTDQIEFTSSYPESAYPNGIFCQST